MPDIKLKGAAFKEDFDYIIKKKGQEGLAKVNHRLKERGAKYDLLEIKDLMVYPLEYRVEFLKAVKDEFKWDDRELFAMARSAPRVNSALKMFVRYMVSLDKALESTSKYWSNYYSAGSLAPLDHDKQKGKISLALYDLPADPILYTELSGYFVGVMDLTGAKGARCPRIARRNADNEVVFHLAYDP
jgi:hypothetical protein